MTVDWLPAWSVPEGQARATALFEKAFGTAPSGAWSAPGRVNVIGEHTDYNGGLCLPIALPHRTYVAAARRDDDTVRLTSAQTAEPWTMPLSEVAPGAVKGWGAYVAGVAWALREAGYEVGGFDAAVDSCVPFGASLSSSAALECAVAVALDDLFGLGLAATAAGRRALIAACIRAENEIAGAATGGLDQSIAMLASPGHALALDFRPRASEEEHDHLVPFDLAAAGLALLVIDTRAPHQLNDGQYASRRESCEQAATALGVASLRDVADAPLDETLSRLRDALSQEAPAITLREDAEATNDPVTIIRRVRHVITEIARTEEFIALIQDGLGSGGHPDREKLARAGALMNASHDSLRDDYQVTVPETDLSVDTCRAAGAFGARMTGGGFGGSTIALVAADRTGVVAAAVAETFKNFGFDAPGFLVATPSAPAE